MRIKRNFLFFNKLINIFLFIKKFILKIFNKLLNSKLIMSVSREIFFF
jgi:hypothetical protein